MIYTVRQKLKEEYSNLSGNEIRDLRLSGVEVCLYQEHGDFEFMALFLPSHFPVRSSSTRREEQVASAVASPEIAFTGDTRSDFMADPENADVLKARVLVMEVSALPDLRPLVLES